MMYFAMPLHIGALEFVPPPPGLYGEGPIFGEGLRIDEIEARLHEGWTKAVAEGRVCSPKNVTLTKAPQQLVRPESQLELKTLELKTLRECGLGQSTLRSG